MVDNTWTHVNFTTTRDKTDVSPNVINVKYTPPTPIHPLHHCQKNKESVSSLWIHQFTENTQDGRIG